MYTNPQPFFICETMTERDALGLIDGSRCFCKEDSKSYIVINGAWKPMSPAGTGITLEEVKADTDIADSLNKKHDAVHNHDAVYEAKNTNIQTHIGQAHAPSNAQANADITKAEIEAKLTGVIATHSHSIATPEQYNQSVAVQGPGFATDTYLVGSNITIPTGSLKIGSRYHLIFNVSKTAAGIATPIIIVRLGTNGSTGDAAILTFTYTAQTAALDTGTFEIWATFRSVGSGTSAVLQGLCQRRHGASITGLGNLVSESLAVTSSGFNSTVSGSKIGVSVNGGNSAAWTIQLVQAELTNLI